MMRVLSPIFPADVKPVRDGWYLIAGSMGWRLVLFSTTRGWGTADPIRWWRGLAFDPAAAVSDELPLYSDEGIFARFQKGVFVPGGECS